MVTDKDGFYTMKGYERSASDEMTSSMEDYLEMVCRMEEEGNPSVSVPWLPAFTYGPHPPQKCWII